MSEEMGVEEAAEFYRRVEDFCALPLWHRDPSPEPRPDEVAWVWPWQDFYPLLLDATRATGVSSKEAERRVITLRNPGLKGGKALGATQTIGTSLQMLLPGEVARAHRHTFHALRFVIQGSGAYTVVNGHKVAMEVGDLVLTPGMCWHDHGHDGMEPMVWMDVLDSGFVQNLRGPFYEEHPTQDAQTVVNDGAADSGYGSPLMAAPGAERSSSDVPVWRYPWAEAYAALRAVPDSEHAERYGAMVEYVNPATGGHVLPTLACYLHRLVPGFNAKARRETPSSVCLVMQGSGRAVIGGKELRFRERDIFVLPGWTFHELIADDQEDLVIFRVSDVPIFEAFNYFQEQLYEEGDGHQPVVEADRSVALA